jgi:parvulin-like peptidyl-prolyl isomerase
MIRYRYNFVNISWGIILLFSITSICRIETSAVQPDIKQKSDTKRPFKNRSISADTIAVIEKQPILTGDFIKRYSDYLVLTGLKDNLRIRKSILDNMTNEILLKDYDDNSKILKDPEYKKELQWNKKQAILAYLKDQEVYAKITISEAELRDAFLKVNEKIAARHLYAANEKDAENLYRLLQSGISFETLAQRVFTDSTLKNNGGYLGYFTWGDMDPAFEDKAYSMKIGEISAPVKTANGYSIIKVEDRVKVPLLTEYQFRQKKSHLERVLKIKKKSLYERNYLNSVYDPSKVRFNEKSLENIKYNLFNLSGNVESVPDKKYETDCVKYGNTIYSQAEIEKRLDQLPEFQRVKINSMETLKRAIEGIVIQDILYKIARAKHYDKNKNVLNTLTKMDDILLLEFKKNEIVNNTTLPDSLIHTYYKENINSFSTPEELNIQEIIVKTESLADSLKILIRNGKDFGGLAEKYSIRDWSAKNKGVMGFAPVSMYGSLKDKFKTANMGDLLGPIKINDYYGIFRVLGKKEARPKDFNSIRDEIVKAVKDERKPMIIADYINQLRSRKHLFTNEKTLDNLPINQVVEK